MNKVKLAITNRNGSREIIPLKPGETTIGRENCHINLGDVKVSRKHASIVPHGSLFKLKDLGSSNGTFVNGKKILETILAENDIITMGGTTIEFHVYRESEIRPLKLNDKTVQLDAKTLDISTEFKGDSLESLKRAKEDLSAIYRTGQELSSIFSSEELYPKALEIILKEIPKADCCSIHIWDEKASSLECMALRFKEPEKSEEHSFSQSIVDCVVKDMKAVLILDTQTDHRVEGSLSIAGMKILSAMCVPLQSKEKLIGVIQANSLIPRNRFSEDDLKLLTTFGMQIGPVVEKIQFYERLEKEKAALNDAHEKLKRAQGSLVQSEKLAAVGQLTAGIAHDVKNPMMVIYGHSRILHDILKAEGIGELDGVNVLESLKEIETGVMHCNDIINNLLQFSRETPAVKIKTQLNDLVKGIIDFLRHEFKKKCVNLEIDFDEKLPETLADQNQLKQVFMNIIINAIQAIEHQGRISILTYPDVSPDGVFSVVKIRDFGCGMPEEVKQKIFDPFFTTKEASETECGGTGLGLSMSYGIIQSHEGSIDVESEPGKGTAFIVKLPAETEDASEESLYTDTSTVKELKKVRI
jgi:signal transduction histidine kinase/pSer/pThr/pTyr-binding forkhead associated (FHA) protein